jgi:hypothetical protein
MGDFINANVQIGSAAASGFAVGGPIGAGIGATVATVKVAIADLVQHSARLKAAKGENVALTQTIAAFDADVQAITFAYNNGQADAATCITACQFVDNAIETNLRQSITATSGAFIPGTSWSVTAGMAGKCNKQCTAGCCVYYGVFGPVLSLMQVAMGGAGGAWGRGDPRYKATPNGAVIHVPEVFANKYGQPDRPGYDITITQPPITGRVQAGITSTIDELFGIQSGPLSGLLPSSGATQSVSPVLLAIGVGLMFVGVLVAVFVGRA